MFEGYLGQALHVARIAAGLSQNKVLAELNKHNKTNLSPALFDGMEKDIEDINAEIFENWYKILPWSKAKVLKCAQLLQQNSHRPEQELLQETLDEAKYQLWKSELENQ